MVIELKHRANRASPRQDYTNLSRMRNELGHPLSIFINIDSEETYIEECTTQTESTVAGFAIKLIDGEVQALEQRNA